MLFKNYTELVKNGQTPEIRKKREDVLRIFEHSIEAVDPYKAVLTCLSEKNIVLDNKVVKTSDFEDIYLIGFGKASVGMSQAVCDKIQIKKGIVITNDSKNKVDSPFIETLVGGHPLPNENCIEATNKILDLMSYCTDRDLLIILISGGGSSLLCKPRIPLDDLQKTTDLLLRSNASIDEINTIRKHLSFVKGGQLVKFNNSMKISLVISDVIGDPLEFIASGPTYPDSTTFNDAKSIFLKYDLWDYLPINTRRIIDDGLDGLIPETLKSFDDAFENVFNMVIANNKIACEAALAKASDLGYSPHIFSTSFSGDSRKAAFELLKFKAEASCNNLFISGGETTVELKGDGKGGRNQEIVLSLVKKISGKNLVFASFATDGVDGNSDAAGAIADGLTYQRASQLGLDPIKYLENNDSYNYFKSVKDLFFTDSTGTNVMDIQILVL